MSKSAAGGGAQNQPSDWKEEFVALFEAAESKLIDPAFLQHDWPAWVANTMREFMKALMPEAKLKIGPQFTPRELGALLGRKVGVSEWFEDPHGFGASPAAALLEKTFASLPPQALALMEAQAPGIVENHEQYPADLDGLRSQALAIAGKATTEEQVEFFNGYIKGIQEGKKGIEPGAFGTTATEVYAQLILLWQSVERMPSVAALHKALQARMGKNRVGDLKRFEKLCERIGLKLRKRGRPRKAK